MPILVPDDGQDDSPFITPEDVQPFADIPSDKLSKMIADASALAMLAAPCLAADPLVLTPVQASGVKAVLRGAIIRWHEAGSGAMQSESIGGYSYALDNRQTRRGMFWPSEITQLQNICGGAPSQAFSVDTLNTAVSVVHADICAMTFGAVYCSCGALLASGLLP